MRFFTPPWLQQACRSACVFFRLFWRKNTKQPAPSIETNLKDGAKTDGLTDDGTRKPDTDAPLDHPTQLTPARLIEAFDSLGYTVFKGPFNLNLFGIRTGLNAGKWDDWIGALYQDDAGEWELDLYQGTTDPSDHWLKKGNKGKGGTAILKEGQYRSCWVRGLHRGNYPALVQHGAKMTVIRDDNLDTVIDVDDPALQEDSGYHGINLHRGSAHRSVSSIGLYSAGCQVICAPGEYLALMDLIDKSSEKYGDTFSYTLFRWPLPEQNGASVSVS